MTSSASITCAGCKHSYADSALYCPQCGRPKARELIEDALIGRVLGDRFLVQEQLGQGASGTIYRAEHVTLRRRVAIKVLHTELSRDDLAVERFRREATTVAEIDNEHIVEIHDFGRTHDGRLYMAMELLEGETLDGVLVREKTLSMERAADVLIQVGEALMEAHAIGYVHRDLRPRNVYLAVRRGKANFVKLLDFGLAKLVETDAQAASTSLGMTFGDPRYMSPEQARGDRIDLRADIYQLGCVAYEMLTGTPPFAGHRVFDILTKQVSEAPAPLPTRRQGVPLWMEAAVAKMLAKDPNNRFATMTRMVEALRRGLETGEVMDDEIARRRESIPPPSVSRVMQRLGVNPDLAGPAGLPVGSAATRTPPMPMPAVPAPVETAKPFDPRSTALGSPPAPVMSPVSRPPVEASAAVARAAPEPRRTEPLAAVAEPAAATPHGAGASASTHHGMGASLPAARPPSAAVTAPLLPLAPSAPVEVSPTAAAPGARRRTGTPRVGVPIVSEHDDDDDDADGQAPVAGTIEPADAPRARRSTGGEPSGRARRPSTSSGLPASGKHDSNATSQVWFEDGEQLDAADSRAARPRKLSSSSMTDLEEEEPPRKSRFGLYAAMGAILVAGTGLVFALGGGSGKTPTPAPTPAPLVATAPVDAAPSTVIETPDAAPAVAIAPPVAPPPVSPPPVTPVGAHHLGGSPDPIPDHLRIPADHGGTHIPSVDDDPAGRRPTFFGTPTPTPTPGKGSGEHGISGADGPVDPYGATDAPPDASGDKKSEFYSNLGSQQLASGDTAAAAASFKRAADLDPKNVTAVTGLGEIALRQGLFGDAIAHLNKAARLAPRSSRVFTLLGEAYMNAGQSTQAVANFKKALQLDPDNARARDGFNEASARVPPPTDDN